MIFYFSGTGNSLYIAKTLSKSCSTQLISITDCIKVSKFHFKTGFKEKIGFVFPVYNCGLPLPVEDFLSKVTFDEKPDYSYIVLCYSTNPGNAIFTAEKILSSQNVLLDGCFKVKMPSCNLISENIHKFDESASILEKADKDIAFISDAVNSKTAHLLKKPLFFLRNAFSLYHVLKEKYFDERLFSVKEDCEYCEKCTVICPMNNISIKDKKPFWGKNCIHCLACINRCPMKVIQYGRITEDRNRYFNEEVF